MLTLRVAPANEQGQAQACTLARAAREVTDESVELAYVDRGYTRKEASAEIEAHSIRLELVKHPGSKRSFVLLPRRWVMERSFAQKMWFRRLVKDYERLPETVAGLPFVPFSA
jgi:transposase